MGTKNYRHNSFTLKGFTLVELLIVFSIIVILAVILIAYFRSQILKGNDARRRADINRMKIAVEEYEKDHNCYPTSVSCLAPTTLQPYLDKIPCDPVTNTPYVYEVPSGTQCPSWYRFYADMDYTQDPTLTPGIGPGAAYNYVSGSDNAPTVLPGSSPTPSPPGGGLGPDGQRYYACRSGVCVPINWNPNRKPDAGPECDPSFGTDNCNNDYCRDFPNCTEWVPQ